MSLAATCTLHRRRGNFSRGAAGQASSSNLTTVHRTDKKLPSMQGKKTVPVGIVNLPANNPKNRLGVGEGQCKNDMKRSSRRDMVGT